MEKLLSLLIWGLAIFGTYGSIGLVGQEMSTGNICPKILGIPACYIILASFLMVLLSHSNLLKDHYWLYSIGAGIAWSIAATGTVGQWMGNIECPKTTGGTPMCYLSLAFFSTLILLKVAEVKLFQN